MSGFVLEEMEFENLSNNMYPANSRSNRLVRIWLNMFKLYLLRNEALNEKLCSKFLSEFHV